MKKVIALVGDKVVHEKMVDTEDVAEMHQFRFEAGRKVTGDDNHKIRIRVEKV